MDAVNELVTDKRFESGMAGDGYVTHDEISNALRIAGEGLGPRTRTLVLLLIHCGRLRGLEKRNSGGGEGKAGGGGARYRIVANP